MICEIKFQGRTIIVEHTVKPWKEVHGVNCKWTFGGCIIGEDGGWMELYGCGDMYIYAETKTVNSAVLVLFENNFSVCSNQQILHIEIRWTFFQNKLKCMDQSVAGFLGGEGDYGITEKRLTENS